MSKRQAEDGESRNTKSAMLEHGPSFGKENSEEDGMGEFEDAWEDDIEDDDEEEVIEHGEDGSYRQSLYFGRQLDLFLLASSKE